MRIDRSPPRRRRGERGFVLVIVLVVGVAALAVAIGLASMSSKHAIAEQRTMGADEAHALAQSGVERTEAWLSEIVKRGDVDFDFALDPDLVAGTNAASCDILGAGITAGAETGVPRFTDAGGSIFANVAFMNGARFREIPYGGGAYLVHVEDNQDDLTSSGAVALSSDNNPGTKGTAPFCAEGPLSLLGADDPVRDADRAVWIVSVGVWPGTDPLTATHRAVMRKLVINPKSSTGAAISVGGDFSCSFMTGNNTVGGIEVSGDMSCGGSMCGSVSAGGAVNNASANAACSGVNAFSSNTSATVTAVSVPAPEDKRFYDWTMPCEFYAKDGDNGGFFYWDPLARRGPGAGVLCSTYNGDVVAPDQDVTVFPNSCWTPIMLPHDGGAQPTNGLNEEVIAYKPFEDTADQVNRSTFNAIGGAAFSPRSGVTVTYPDPGTATKPWSTMLTSAAPNGLRAESYPRYFMGAGTPGHFDVHLPEWTSCSSSAGGSKSRVNWPPPPAAGARVTCNGATGCNGGSGILVWQRAGGASSFQFLPAPTNAFVTGIYYKEGSWSNTRSFPSTLPTVQATTSQWPMITFAVQQDVSFPNNNDVAFGVGTAADGLNGGARSFFPSLIVGRDLDQGAGNANLATAGFLYVRGNASFKKHLHAFGPIAVQGNLSQGAGGNPGIVWDYTLDTLGVGAASPAIPPIVSYPMSF